MNERRIAAPSSEHSRVFEQSLTDVLQATARTRSAYAEVVEARNSGVTADVVPDLILTSIPSLRKEWPEIEEENADPEGVGGRLGYLDAAWVVRHLADRCVAGDTSEFAAAFALIEHLIQDGDAYVSELGVVGYLEGLQTATVTSRGLDPEAFRPWFGPLSQRYWDAINEFWANGTTIPNLESDNDPEMALRRGEFVAADRLTLVSRVGWIDLKHPTFIQVGERYRVDWDANTVIAQRLDGATQPYESKPSGPDSIR